MFAKIVIALSIIVVVAAHYQHYEQQNKQAVIDTPKYEVDDDHHVDYYAYPKYKYKYGVEDGHTGDHKTHIEERDGELVKGEYTTVDADGTIRTVKYTADKDGYKAVVYKNGKVEDAEVKSVPNSAAVSTPEHDMIASAKEKISHKYEEYLN